MTGRKGKSRTNDEGEFQQFVRDALTEIRRSQSDLYRRIDKLEESFNSSLEFESKRISELESRIKELENITPLLDKADKQLSDHSEKINKLERFSRRNNVKIIGLPQDKNEDCLVIVSKLLTDRFDMPNIQLERAHRDGPKTPGRPQHVLVKFNGYQHKIKVLRLQRLINHFSVWRT